MAKRRIADLYEIKCTACGAPLKVEEGELIICPYCGTQFAFEDFEEEEEPREIYYEPSFWDTRSGHSLMLTLIGFGILLLMIILPRFLW